VSAGHELERGSAALDELLRKLDDQQLAAIVDPYAEAVLEAARSAAGSHPTPQSRMGASGLVAQHGEIISPPGALVLGRGGRPALLEEIIAGAEWGSGTYRQFAPRNTRGYWLIPSTESDSAISAGDRALEAVLESVT
jgi:hypothetical protein